MFVSGKNCAVNQQCRASPSSRATIATGVCAHERRLGHSQWRAAPAADSPQGEVAGPKGTGKAKGQQLYGVDGDEGCKPETALACGTVECKA